MDAIRHTPNGKDQLPGRLQRLHTSEGENAGPVNCIRWLARAKTPLR
jgi:hypothetical protein